MKRVVVFLMAIGLLCSAVGAQANTFNFTGDIVYHNDVVQFNFSLANPADVRIWTDSFRDFTNFDPNTALWTGSGDLIAEYDDDATINPATQTLYDSGCKLPGLAAGDYIFTVTSYPNFAKGTTLSEGFEFDGNTPIPIGDFWLKLPGYYSVTFDGVDHAAAAPVPIPGAIWMLGSGLLGMAGVRRKLRK